MMSDYAKGALTDRVLAAAIAEAPEAGRPIIVDPKRCRRPPIAGRPSSRRTARNCSSRRTRRAARRCRMRWRGVHRHRGDGRRHPADPVRAGHVALSDKASRRYICRQRRARCSTCRAPATRSPRHGARHCSEPVGRDRSCIANIAAGIVVGQARHSERQVRLSCSPRSRSRTTRPGRRARRDQPRRRQGAARDLGPGRPEGRLHQWLFRHPACRPRRAAAPGGKACDRLIVALNTDASVSRLKGPSRPVQAKMCAPP